VPRRQPPSAACGRPPTSSSSDDLDISGFDMDTEMEVEVEAALQDPDIIAVSFDRYTDSPAPASPAQERALDDAVGRAAPSPRLTTPAFPLTPFPLDPQEVSSSPSPPFAPGDTSARLTSSPLPGAHSPGAT